MSGLVKPSSKSRAKTARKNNPSIHGYDISDAASLYERFTGHTASEKFSVKVPAYPSAAAVIGTCDGILYTTVRDGVTEKYIHKFRQKDKPLLCVSPDGSQILLIGGAYRFTELGIVDASDKKHSSAR
jgi:hypothetical protein